MCYHYTVPFQTTCPWPHIRAFEDLYTDQTRYANNLQKIKIVKKITEMTLLNFAISKFMDVRQDILPVK